MKRHHQHRHLRISRLPRLLIASSSFSSIASGLNIALLTGSTRTTGPPIVLGPRVNTYIQTSLENRGHTVTHIDPKQFTLLEKPYFGYGPGKSPLELQTVQTILTKADAYVCITPEYNHSPSPALMNVLNHFGSSTFSFKPSAIGKCIRILQIPIEKNLIKCALTYIKPHVSGLSFPSHILCWSMGWNAGRGCIANYSQ
jgi:hypothetical protein